jgi:hypothetical protein
VGLEVVAISWGKERVTSPVEAEAVTWFAVPVIEVTPLEAPVKVIDPPNSTDPPPDNVPEVEMVIFELAKLEFETPPEDKDTAPLVTLKLLDEKEAIPKTVLVAVATLTLEEMVGL